MPALVVENFFALRERRYHELALCFEMTLPDGSPAPDRHPELTGDSGVGYRLVYRWFPLAAIADMRLYPAFLCTALPNPPASPEHVVVINGDD